jgi:hypothetical protein
MSRIRLLPRILCMPLLLLAAGVACAQVRHCVSADGTDIYTDKRCDQLGAVPALPPVPSVTGTTAYRPTCARTLRDLAFELQSAIDSQDVNRLAASYVWNGMSTRNGYAVLDRLAAITQRPLLDIVPLYGGTDESEPLLPAVPRRAPVALRLEQTLRNSTTPAATVLSLHRELGCWWVRF